MDGVRWPGKEGGGPPQSAATHLLLQTVCPGPAQVTPDTVGVKEQTVCKQTDEKGVSSPLLY